MKKFLTLIPALALLHAEPAAAGPLSSPKKQYTASGLKRELSEKIQQNRYAYLKNSGITGSKTTSTERLTSIAYYDLTGSGNPLVDSVRVTYSNGRGSKFNFMDMSYGTDELDAGDIYGYINFDSAYDELQGGVQIAHRSYNTNNKVVEEESVDGEKNVYSYNSSNQLIQKTTSVYNSSTGGWDNDSRYFFKYNGAGQRILDSIENWDETGLTWKHDAKNSNFYDGNGRIIKSVESELYMGSFQAMYEHTYTYTGSLPVPSTYIFSYYNTGSMSMEDIFKDTTGYTGNMPVFRNSYVWDGMTSGWVLNAEERRHLNAASLPDSISYTYRQNGSIDEQEHAKYLYNSNNNPILESGFSTNPTTAEYKIGYGYGPVESASVATQKSAQLEFYPNPASDKIYLKGLTRGSYLIYNTAGQLLQSGSVQNGSVPVESLAPGLYLLSIQNNGSLLQANFLRQ